MTHFVNHVTFGMPAFVAVVMVDLHKLLQDCTITSSTLHRKLRQVVKMAVHVILMLIVQILRAKDSWADQTCKMFDMVLFVWIRNVSFSISCHAIPVQIHTASCDIATP